MKHIDVNFFPGWVRKSISFTIDDGNIQMDEKFLSIVKPAGILGTFNLCTPLKKTMSAEDYRRFYRGYGIANHCHRHPHAFSSKRNPTITDEAFDEATADTSLAYPMGEEGFYRIFTRNWNYYIATDDKYMEFVDTCANILCEIFGEDARRDFVWPFGDQMNPALTERLIKSGLRSIRATGDLMDSTGFALPADRMCWSYNASNRTLLKAAELYEKYPDDGDLKLFCFGVHSIDFDRDGNWQDLEDFCRDFGNRPDYWYASMNDIFAYEDAVKAIRITQDRIENDSAIDLYVKIDGEKKKLCAYSSLPL
jgi:hypothetical protein